MEASGECLAWFLAEGDLWTAPDWLLNSYLGEEELELILLVGWDLDLNQVPYPGGGQIAAAAPSLINLDGWLVLDIYKQMATLKIKSDPRLLLRDLKIP